MVTLMLVVVELPLVAVVAVAAAVLVDPADPEDAGCVGMLPGVSDLAAWPGRTAAGSKHSELIVPICPGRQHNWPAVLATLGSAAKGAVIVERKSPQLLSAQAGETVNELKQSSLPLQQTLSVVVSFVTEQVSTSGQHQWLWQALVPTGQLVV